MTDPTTVGGFAGDPAEALAASTADGCCGSSTGGGGCCGTDAVASDGCCG